MLAGNFDGSHPPNACRHVCDEWHKFSATIRSCVIGEWKACVDSGLAGGLTYAGSVDGAIAESLSVPMCWLEPRLYTRGISSLTHEVVWSRSYPNAVGIYLRRDVLYFARTLGVRWCYYKETERILGQTFGVLVLQDFEALTPNLLARTIETVEGGGLVIFLLKTVTSLQQLYAMSMDVHARFALFEVL